MGLSGMWDEEHLARHAISPWEVEEVFYRDPVWVADVRHGSDLWWMTGMTDRERCLTIVVQVKPQQRTLHAFTGWDCSERDYRRYST